MKNLKNLWNLLTKLNPYKKIKEFIDRFYGPVERNYKKITFCFLILVLILPPLIRAIL